ncbi:hypothetical protein HHI36_024234, partial [Cryptolaemus montrouzieri]
KLEECLEQIVRKGYGKICVLGDFNIDNLKKDEKSKEFLNLMNTFDLLAAFKEPTKISKIRKSCKYNVFTNLDNSTYD